MNAVFRKELWDVLRWTPIGTLLISIVCWSVVPSNVNECTQLDSNLLSQVGIACGLIALALGWLQSLPDTRSDIRGYMIHRPVGAARIYWGKLMAGFVAYLVCVLPPLAVTAVYLESIGPEQLPTCWQQTIPAFLASLIIFVLHPTAMWTAYREARWIGTRGLPLALSVPVCFVACAVLFGSRAQFVWVWYLMVVIVAALWSTVLFASLHAFAHEAFSPAAGARERTSVAGTLGLSIASIVLVSIVATLLLVLVPPSTSTPFTHYRLAVASDGSLWEISETHENQTIVVEGRPIEDSNNTPPFQPLPKSWQESSTATFYRSFRAKRNWFDKYTLLGSFPSSSGQYSTVLIAAEGRLLRYSNVRNGLQSVISPDGSTERIDRSLGTFDRPRMMSALRGHSDHFGISVNPIIVGNGGVYQLHGDSVRKILDSPIDDAVMTATDDQQAGSIWTLSGNQLQQYRINPLDADDPLRSIDEERFNHSRVYPMPLIDIQTTDSLTIDPLDHKVLVSVARTNDGRTAVWQSNGARTSYQVIATDGAVLDEGEVRWPVQSPDIQPQLAMYSPAYAMADPFCRQQTRSLGSRMLILLHAIIAAVLAFWQAGRRGLKMTGRIVWFFVAALAGIGSVLAIVAIYPRLVFETCARCEAPRRVDRDHCGSCNAAWDPSPPEGIEIFGPCTASLGR